MDGTTLPTLDLSLHVRGTEAQRANFASRLSDSLRKHGFVKLTGHGIEDEKVAELFRWNKAFFALSQAEKLRITHEGAASEPQRGYSGIGVENSARLYRQGMLKASMTEDLHDCREHFDAGSPTDCQFPTPWPPEYILPGFRTFMEETFKNFETIAAHIMSALEIGLSVPKSTFNNNITNSHNASELRLNHYPAIEFAELRKGSVSRIWPHFDLGVITLLFQDRVSGLEFEDRAAPAPSCDCETHSGPRFRSVQSNDPSEMIVNVSETLQRWTNGKLPAGLHRVGIPSELNVIEDGMLRERFSVPYFVKADRDANVGSLKEFVEVGEKKLYDDMTAIEYHLSRIQSAY